MKKKVNECEGMNTLMNTNGIGNPFIENGVGSGDLWGSKTKNKKKKYKIHKKVSKSLQIKKNLLYLQCRTKSN